jgi:cardiolipin synthase
LITRQVQSAETAVRGPVVLEAQAAFVEDWRWTTDEVLELNWIPERAPESDMLALCLPTGPADRLKTGTLMMLDLIISSRQRIWIASPYFL